MSGTNEVATLMFLSGADQTSPYLALWAASRRPLLDLMRVDVRHAPWRDLITEGLLVWRPHRGSPWQPLPPGHQRRRRAVMGEVDVTPTGWGVLGDVDRAGALVGQQQAALAPLPHRCEGWRLLMWDIKHIQNDSACRLNEKAARLAYNTSIVRAQAPAMRPVCDGTPGSIPSDDVVGRWYRRPHVHVVAPGREGANG